MTAVERFTDLAVALIAVAMLIAIYRELRNEEPASKYGSSCGKCRRWIESSDAAEVQEFEHRHARCNGTVPLAA